jgi:orotate phosphoribosyltransferase
MSINIPDSYRQEALETIIDAGVWEFGDFAFAGGQPANNKFQMDRVLREPYQESVVRPLGLMALSFVPDVLIGVPTGGTLFAERLGEATGINVAQMSKSEDAPGSKTYDFATERDRELVVGAETVVIVEDVLNRRTSTLGMLQNVAIRSRARVVVTPLDRGVKSQQKAVCIPVEAIVQEEVPDIITPDHPFFQKYSRRAINNHLIRS